MKRYMLAVSDIAPNMWYYLHKTVGVILSIDDRGKIRCMEIAPGWGEGSEYYHTEKIYNNVNHFEHCLPTSSLVIDLDCRAQSFVDNYLMIETITTAKDLIFIIGLSNR